MKIILYLFLLVILFSSQNICAHKHDGYINIIADDSLTFLMQDAVEEFIKKSESNIIINVKYVNDNFFNEYFKSLKKADEVDVIFTVQSNRQYIDQMLYLDKIDLNYSDQRMLHIFDFIDLGYGKYCICVSNKFKTHDNLLKIISMRNITMMIKDLEIKEVFMQEGNSSINEYIAKEFEIANIDNLLKYSNNIFNLLSNIKESTSKAAIVQLPLCDKYRGLYKINLRGIWKLHEIDYNDIHYHAFFMTYPNDDVKSFISFLNSNFFDDLLKKYGIMKNVRQFNS